MRLVPDWKSCWRWFSVQLMAVSAAIQATMLALPPSLASYVPEDTMRVLALMFVVGAVGGRLVHQDDPPVTPKEDHARLG